MKHRYSKVENVVNYILCWFSMRNTAVTPKKLQKLLFLVYSFYLVFTNDDANNISNRLFNNEFEAWAHGPVYPYIYRKYRDYGMSDIFYNDLGFDFDLSNYEKSIIDVVLNEFASYKAYQLEDFTHSLDCWINKHKDYSYFDICNESIDDKEIYKDFQKFVA